MNTKRSLHGLDRFFLSAFLLATGIGAALVMLTYDAWPLKIVSIGMFPNLVWTAAIAAAVCMGVRHFGKRQPQCVPMREKGALGFGAMLGMTAAVFILQALIYSQIYRAQMHDAKIVLNAAYCNAMGYPQYRDTVYFDTCPNNLFLLAMETLLLSLPKALLGMELGMERCTLLLVLLQCAINAASGFAVMLLARRVMLDSGAQAGDADRAALFAWGLWLLLIGMSAWISVIYSDSMTVLLPVLFLLLYAHRGEGRRALAVYALIGLLGGAAYRMKPQSSLAMIAILIVDGAALLVKRMQAKAFIPRMAAMLACAALLIGPGTKLAARISDMEPDPEMAFGMTHYLNLGLNADTHGIFSPDDVGLSMSVTTSAERTQLNLQTAKERLERMGAKGFVVHLWDKAMINFADGSFQLDDFASVSREGTSGAGKALESVFHHDGAYHPLLHTAQQGAWIFVLMMCPFAALAFCAMRRVKKPGADTLLAMMLTVVGVMLFNMMFEARGRYIFSNAPVMIVLAIVGFSALMRRAKEKANQPG